VLKARLADAHRFDLAAYIDGKDAFVKEHCSGQATGSRRMG
jgi:hypothetical protein